jgi:hypothetical protein
MSRMAASPSEHPIRLVVRDEELRRTRLTVFFRVVLAIPVLVWLTLRGIAAFFVGFANWLAVVIQKEVPDSLHEFTAGYVRYSTQVSAYLFLAADPYPWFRVQPDYPVDVEIDPPREQGRWGGFFRILLALPALALAAALGSGLTFGPSGGSSSSTQGGDYGVWWGASAAGAAALAAFLAWFYALARGRAPRGIRDLVAYSLGYGAQAIGYLLLLTGRYPSSDPALAEPYAELPRHPVQLVVTDSLARSRLTVFFRLFLALPHLVWITLWSVAVVFAAIAAWLAALVTGTVPGGLHRFLAAYVRYAVHVQAYLYVIGRRFPGFTGRPGSYGIDLEIDPPQAQRRWLTLLRLFLAVPALLLGGALGGVLLLIAFLAWWYALVRGAVPEGLRNLGAACIRYLEQTSAYLLLLTDRYPYAAPVLQGRPAGRSPLPGPSPLPMPGLSTGPVLGDAL